MRWLAILASLIFFALPAIPQTYLPFVRVVDGGASPITIDLNVSRTSGTAPLYVFFDAIGTTHSSCTGDCDEYIALKYEWDFDSSDGTWAATAKSKDSATGPMAAKVFETADTYDVVLTVTGEDGSTDTDTVQIVVAEPDTTFTGTATYCFSNDTDHTGCPSGAVQVSSVSDADVLLDSNCGVDGADIVRRCLFKRGDTFTLSATTQLQDGPIHIGAYGTTGADPIIDSSAVTGTEPFQIGADGGTGTDPGSTDVVVTGLHFIGEGSYNPGSSSSRVILCGEDNTGVSNFLFFNNVVEDHIELLLCGANHTSGTAPVPDLIGVFGNTTTNPGSRSWGFFQATRMAVVGNDGTNADLSDSGGMRIKAGKYFIVQSNKLRYDTFIQNDPIKLPGTRFNFTSALIDDDEDDGYYLISDNDFAFNASPVGGTVNGIGGYNDLSSSGAIYHHGIIERNIMRALAPVSPNTGGNRAFQGCWIDLAIRNNVFIYLGTSNSNPAWDLVYDDCDAGTHMNYVGGTDSIRNHVYNNMTYIGVATGTKPIFNVGSGFLDSFIRNNLVYNPNSTSTTSPINGTLGSGSAASDNTRFDDAEFAGDSANGGDDTFDEVAEFKLISGSSYLDSCHDFFATDEDGASLFDDLAGVARTAGVIDCGPLVSP